LAQIDLFEYRDRHRGEECILLGGGPTVLDFDFRHAEGRILIGSNEAVYLPVRMDYYFIGDAGSRRRGFLSDPETYRSYQPRFEYFVRNKERGAYKPIPHIPGSKRYEVTTATGGPFLEFDLSRPLRDRGSISFEALQFALWCGFSRIILVGHDCTYAEGSFHSPKVDRATMRWGERILNAWSRIAQDLQGRRIEIVRPVAMREFPEAEL